MSKLVFDDHAEAYDSWFMDNENVLESEVRLLARALGTPGHALSVGCGTGLFEMLLAKGYGIEVRDGVEPAEAMAEVARKRGMTVAIGIAEELPYDDELFDTVYMNGCPSYVANLERAFEEARRVLKPGGRLVVLDVPAESSYALLYRFAAAAGSWQDPRLNGVAPAHPYPIELASSANWRTTPEKLRLLEAVGLEEPETWQTLTVHPTYSNDTAEEPTPGHTRGDYVAICATKP